VSLDRSVFTQGKHLWFDDRWIKWVETCFSEGRLDELWGKGFSISLVKDHEEVVFCDGFSSCMKMMVALLR